MADGALLTVKDVVRCPKCGSAEIVYTCEPKCCFNHLCEECRTTFQLVTRKAAGQEEARRADVREPESGDPTAACAGCESLRVYVAGSGGTRLACAECGVGLELAYEEIDPA